MTSGLSSVACRFGSGSRVRCRCSPSSPIAIADETKMKDARHSEVLASSLGYHLRLLTPITGFNACLYEIGTALLIQVPSRQ